MTEKKKRPFLWGCGVGFVLGFVAPVVLLVLVAVLFREQLIDRMAGQLEPPSLSHGIQGAYDWEITDPDGTPYAMSQTRGKAVFLHFWGPECPSCQAELPSLNALHDAVKDDPRIAFVCVALADFDEVKELVAAGELRFPAYTFEGVRPEVYGQTSVPVTYLIQPDGEIAYKHAGSARWDEAGPADYLRALAAQMP